MLPRLQLFEFNDADWTPAALRDTLIEALSGAMRRGHIVDPLAEPLAELLDETKTDEVLDLCSGSGGPVEGLVQAMQRSGRAPPKFFLSDLYPHIEDWGRLKARYPGVIDFEPQSIDVLRLKEHQRAGRVQLVINALHHFRPEQAQQLLLGATQGAAGVFVAESFERNPLRFLPVAKAGLPALFLTPLLSPKDRLLKVALTWFTPLALAAGTWDGVVSTLRVYSEAELRAFVEPAGNHWQWDYGTFSFGRGGRGAYFRGRPVPPKRP